MFTKPVTDP